jgi:hypothetical protein
VDHVGQGKLNLIERFSWVVVILVFSWGVLAFKVTQEAELGLQEKQWVVLACKHTFLVKERDHEGQVLHKGNSNLLHCRSMHREMTHH